MNKQTPSQGLKILEKIHKKQPNNQWVSNNLINAYIKLGYHDIALKMVANIPDNKVDVQTLRFKAWAFHKHGDIDKEKQCWDEILEKSFEAQVHNKIDTLLLRSNKEIKLEPSDIPLFCVERNEMLRLPFFLEYYRNLGVTQFVFVDNNSDDGSFEFLLQQDDCHVFWTNDRYITSCGIHWLRYLIDKYTYENQWSLIIDADEFLVYPDCEYRKLSELIAYLEKYDYEAFASFVVDMFPKSIDEQLNINAENSLIRQSPYFYNQYVFEHQIECPYQKVRGGIFHMMGQSMPLNVTPLIKKTNKPISLLSSRHITTAAKVADITSCLLHFKFLGDFYEKSLKELKRKEHWGGGIQYQGYARLFEDQVDESFYFSDLSKTTKYQNSQQLVELGLIKTSDAWERLR